MQPFREIRAVFDAKTIRVYQAFSDDIADSALAHGTFVSPPFSMNRMTWIKPSFLWMMYRAGWGLKEAGQKRILGIDIARDGFEWALANSSLSHSKATDASPPVRVQWDPERDFHLAPLSYRSIQIGLSGVAVGRYVGDWIRQIVEVTALAREMRAHVERGEFDRARSLLPNEQPYPTSDTLRAHLEMG